MSGMPLRCLKLLHACDQWHLTRVCLLLLPIKTVISVQTLKAVDYQDDHTNHEALNTNELSLVERPTFVGNLFAGRFFHFSQSTNTRGNAKKVCSLMGGFLATIDSTDKMIAIVEAIPKYMTDATTAIWNGCSAAGGGGWLFGDEDAEKCTRVDTAGQSNPFWNDENPQSTAGDCVAMIAPDWRWNNLPCDGPTSHFLCETTTTTTPVYLVPCDSPDHNGHTGWQCGADSSWIRQAACYGDPTRYNTCEKVAAFLDHACKCDPSDIDECQTENKKDMCGNNGTCTESSVNTNISIGDFVCNNCRFGFEGGTNKNCTDINECAAGNAKMCGHDVNICTDSTTVADVPFNHFSCECGAGWEGGGLDSPCTDVDECAAKVSNIVLRISPEGYGDQDKQEHSGGLHSENTHGVVFLTDGKKIHANKSSGFWYSSEEDDAAAKVTFEHRAVVYRVVVTNRCDLSEGTNHTSWLTGAVVVIGQSADGTETQCGGPIEGTKPCEDAVLECGDIEGDYVVIRKSSTSNSLNIVELEVYGARSSVCGQGGTCTDSTGNCGCEDKYSAIFKPWEDFISCALEKPHCADHPGTLQKYCANTCGTCADDATCITNTVAGSNIAVGDFVCTCASKLDGDGTNTVCDDANECSTGHTEVCGEGGNCNDRNTDPAIARGDFVCTCPFGFIGGTNRQCTDIDECTDRDVFVCGEGGTCLDSTDTSTIAVGMFVCTCDAGRDGGGENVACTAMPEWVNAGHDKSDYLFPAGKLTWDNANAACSSEGGSLATVDSADEFADIKGLIQNHSHDGTSNLWIGCREIAQTDADTTNAWKWVNGEHDCNPPSNASVATSFWIEGQPNDAPLSTDLFCASMVGGNANTAMHTEWKWDDSSCKDPVHYLCERPPSECNSALSIADRWEAEQVISLEWPKTVEVNEVMHLVDGEGAPLSAIKESIWETRYGTAPPDVRRRCTECLEADLPRFVANKFVFSLRWSSANVSQTYTIGGTPPGGLYNPNNDVPDPLIDLHIPGDFVVGSSTGEILGKPTKAGNFTLWLILEDHFNTRFKRLLPAHNQVVVAKWQFEVIPESDTAHSENGPNRQDCGANGTPVDGTPHDQHFTCTCTVGFNGKNCNTSIACNPNQSIVNGKCETLELENAAQTVGRYKHPKAFAVGETYHIAPFRNYSISPSVGHVNKLTYSVRNGTTAGIPPGLFVKKRTGEIAVSFEAADANANYSIIPDVTDAGGARVVLDPIFMSVRYKDTDLRNSNCNETNGCKNFNLTFDGRAHANSKAYSDPHISGFTAGVSYKIASRLFRDNTTYSSGTKADVRYFVNEYKLDGAPADIANIFVNPNTGEIVVSFPSMARKEPKTNVSFLLNAMDKSGCEKEVELFDFEMEYPALEASSLALSVPLNVSLKSLNKTERADMEREIVETSATASNGTFVPTDVASVTLDQKQDDRTKTPTPGAGKTRRAATPPSTAPIQATLIFKPELTIDLLATEEAINDAIAAGKMVVEVLIDGVAYSAKVTEFVETDAGIATLQSQVALYQSTSIAAGSLIGVMLLMFVAVKIRQHQIALRPVDFRSLFEDMIDAGEISNPQGALPGFEQPMPREIPRQCISKSAKIGEGAFGEVFKGLLDESGFGGVPGYLVACKSVTDPSGDGAKDLLQEATIMAQVGINANLVSLIGVVTSGTPLLLIIALCEHGSLQSQLKKRPLGDGKLYAPPGTLPVKMDVDIAVDIAKGMNHLVQHHLVHRDLATRNVLLSSALVGMVADFGLSRAYAGDSEYYKSSSGMMALRWTAPEAMETLRFSMATDVWAFGVVLLEIAVNGDTPLKDLTNQEVMANITSGYKPPKPPTCPASLYKVMCQCWSIDPAERPSFAELVQTLSQDEFGTAIASWGPQGRIMETSFGAPGVSSKKEPATVSSGNSDETLKDGYVVQPDQSTRAANMGLYSQQPVNTGVPGDPSTTAGYVMRSDSVQNRGGQALYSQQPSTAGMVVADASAATTAGYEPKALQSQSNQKLYSTDGNDGGSGDGGSGNGGGGQMPRSWTPTPVSEKPRDAYIELLDSAAGAGMQESPAAPDSYLVIGQGGAPAQLQSNTPKKKASKKEKNPPPKKKKKKKAISAWAVKQELDKRKAGAKAV
jgi:serine/threonine protein kinase